MRIWLLSIALSPCAALITVPHSTRISPRRCSPVVSALGPGDIMLMVADSDVASAPDVSGLDPWGVWQNFISGSIVSTHDLLYSAGVTENTYGFAIMIFTFTLRVLTLPLTWLQFSSTEKQKAMQPLIAEIKTRFSDSESQNMMVAKLYEDTNSNPFVGCVVPLLQIPVFIALYRSILNLATDKALDESFLFLPSLEGPTLTEKLMLPEGRGIQWLSEGWQGSYADGTLTPALGWHDTLAYVTIPIILVLAQAITQKLTMPPAAATTDPAVARTQGIVKYVPLMIGFFSLQVPAALGVYWFTSNIFTAAATVSIKKYWELNPPKIDWTLPTRQGPPTGTLGASLFKVDMPATMEEAIADARLNARPPRAPRQRAIQAAQ